MNAFLHRFGSMISGVLDGFDRLVFMGSLRSLVYAPRMVVYLSRVGLLIKDFTRWTQDLGNQIKFKHRTFGFMHVRLQTWAPYTVRVSINGREWLARQMDQAGIAYVRRDPGAPGLHRD